MSGQEAQFAEWMREHFTLLHRVSRAFAEPADQHDLLQELMLAVWKAAPSFRGDSAPATFIFRVAHNRAITWRRRESGRLSRDASAHREWSIRIEDGDADDAALLERLYAAIRQLGALDRSLVLLSLEGVPYREIAQLHDLTETNVGVRLNRARRQLTLLVEETGNGL